MFGRRKPPQPQGGNVGGQPLPVSVRSEPLVGYRMWRVQPQPSGLALTSLNIRYTWQVENDAECIQYPNHVMIPFPKFHPGEPSPHVECACGLYAALPNQPLGEWEHIVAGIVHASGSVALTGRVIRCQLGFKAEHATIQSPVVLGAYCVSSQACTGDVVAVDLQPGRVRGWCTEHAPEGAEDAAVWFGNAVNELEHRYAPVEFLSWVGGEM